MQFGKSSTVLICMILSACGSDDTCDRPLPYLNSQEGGELVIPVGLTAPSRDNQQSIPTVADNRKSRSNPCSSGPPELIIERSEIEPQEELVTANTGAERSPLTIAPGFNSDSVEQTLEEWIKSWRAADSARYLSFYAQDFRGSNEVTDREEWLNRRRDLLEITGQADISIRDVVVEELPAGRKLVRLIQEFQNGGETHSVLKVIELIREGEGWRIRREQVVEVL